MTSTPFDALLRQRKTFPHRAAPDEISRLLALAERDIRAAPRVMAEDWAFSSAHSAELQAARAYMYARGFRPAGGSAGGAPHEAPR